MPTIDILNSFISYEELGEGDPIVFLHGNPTSSHLWRNIMPGIGPGRYLAPDLIGMGRSGKPDIGYRYGDHIAYLDAWFDALDLDDVVLVGHDWGGALAFDWASRHVERVRGIAFMETILRPMGWYDLPGGGKARYELLRGAGTGETKVLDENFFIEQALRATTLKGLSDADWDVYRAPYPDHNSRRPLLEWPRAMPINGEPADVVARIEAYDRWLCASPQTPKLLLTFDGPSETLLIGSEMISWCRDNIAGLEIRGCGPARHIAPEDQPEAIAAEIKSWIDRKGLRTAQRKVASQT
ncbi:haloalkane dehalogenase [Rhizobium leguminosarum]|uniref:haloalkane dehalogenase n=1 Tax=Rhizobium leguminosarum TaxID=384 RepID=UPI001C911405|nr:haloalkane dehalogenase [Rhizobium leguminosarum]MBY2933308.1 haloalkane dehalogenase [Rhizobium leguminosarum]